MTGDTTVCVQPGTLAQTTAGRIRRMAGQIEDDLQWNRQVSVAAAMQICQAAITLIVEVTRIAERDGAAA